MTKFRSVSRWALPAAALLATLTDTAHAATTYAECGGRQPNEADVEGAKGAHRTAETYYQQGKYEKAIERWIEAYSLDCTAHRLLINVGNAFERLAGVTLSASHLEEALRALETYVQRAGLQADPVVKNRIVELKDRLKTLKSAPPPIPPGNGGAGRGEPPPREPVDKGDTADEPSVTPWVLIGVGSAAALAGTVVWGVGLGKQSDAEDVCPDRECPTPRDENEKAAIDEAKKDGDAGVIMAWVGGAIALAGVGTAAIGVILKLTEGPEESASGRTAERAFASAPLTVTPFAGPGAGGLSLGGRF
jgi:tetratricopeptide (TPR) repeat protein